MLKEFRDFLMRGNILDLAVAVVIGGAFGTIVKSFVADIIMPPIGLLLGGVDFTNLFIDLSGVGYATLAAAQEAGAATINYGLFLNTVVNFIIVAFAIFMVLKGVKNVEERRKKQEEAAPATPPEPSAEEKLLAEIRDLLKTK
jgi:large conductance mechanosensitive channel